VEFFSYLHRYIRGTQAPVPPKRLRNEIFEELTQNLDEEAFTSRSKDGKKGIFIRDRKLRFKTVLVSIMRGFKSSIHRDLNDFIREVDGGTFNIRHVSKGAFTKARSKLRPDAFVELNKKAVDSFY